MMVPTATPSPRLSWSWAVGAAGLVLAARLHEIHAYTGDVPINDQWQIEGASILAPWLDGTLRLASFFEPHFEHVPAFTRFLAWLQVVLTGRWDPLLQATVNATLFAGYIALVTRWVTSHLRPLAAMAVVGFFAGNAALPHVWENITWGFQSQFPLALLSLFLHLRGSFEHAPFTRGWWWAQVAGVAGLFTLASMWIAPLTIVLVSLWTDPRGDRRRLGSLVIVALGIAMLVAIRLTRPPDLAFVQTAGSPLRFLYALLDLLGWPNAWPGSLAVLNLPLLLFALQLRGRRDATAFDRTVLALGLWGAAQAAALAYARNVDYGGYVSRYGELLAVLVLANSLALARLIPALPRARAAGAAFALLWGGVVAYGAWELSIGGHTAYFHEHAVRHAQVRRDAVQAFVQRGDRSLLDQAETRRVLYPLPDIVAGLLARPGIQALLPHSVNPANPPDAAGSAVRALQAGAPWLAIVSGLLLAVGVTTAWRRERESALPAFMLGPEPLLPWIAGTIAVGASVVVFLWPDPLTLDLGKRWRHFFHPPGSIGSLEMTLVRGSSDIPGSHLYAAVPLSPPDVRLQFSGTNPGGDDFTCTAWSQPFTLTTDWVVVPFAGYPTANGNGLRLRIEADDGSLLTEVACPGPNAFEIFFWTADVRAYRGKQARLVLYDGRTATDAWVGAAPPILTSDPDLGAHLTRQLPMERLAHVHAACGRLALGAILLLAAGLGWRRPGGPGAFSAPI